MWRFIKRAGLSTKLMTSLVHHGCTPLFVRQLGRLAEISFIHNHSWLFAQHARKRELPRNHVFYKITSHLFLRVSCHPKQLDDCFPQRIMASTVASTCGNHHSPMGIPPCSAHAPLGSHTRHQEHLAIDLPSSNGSDSRGPFRPLGTQRHNG